VQIEFFERRQSGGQRSAGWPGVILHGWWRLYFVRRELVEYFCWILWCRARHVRCGSPCAYSRRDVAMFFMSFSEERKR
jgi:hypothetical protein